MVIAAVEIDNRNHAYRLNEPLLKRIASRIIFYVEPRAHARGTELDMVPPALSARGGTLNRKPIHPRSWPGFSGSWVKAPAAVRIEIVFLDDKTIRLFNKRYKKRDRATDVLSFNIDAGELGPGNIIGQVLISSDTAFRNSKTFGTKFEEEIVLYMVHGILHIFGYDDASAKDGRVMSKAQGAILRKLCGKEDLSKVLTRR